MHVYSSASARMHNRKWPWILSPSCQSLMKQQEKDPFQSYYWYASYSENINFPLCYFKNIYFCVVIITSSVNSMENNPTHHKAVFLTACTSHPARRDNHLKAWCFMRFIMGTDLYLWWGGKIEVIRSWCSLRLWIMVNILGIIKTASSSPPSYCLCYAYVTGPLEAKQKSHHCYLFGGKWNR